MILSKVVDFKDIETDWRQWEKDGHIPTVFQTFDWAECWWKHFGFRGEHFLIGVFDREELIGIAPLYRTMMKVRGFPLFKVLRILGSPESDYNSFIVKPSRGNDALAAILNHLMKLKWDIFWFSDIHSEIMGMETFETTLQKGNYYYVKKKHTQCPYIRLPATFTEYKNTLSKHSRLHSNNLCNRVLKLEGICYEKVEKYPDIAPSINALIGLHQDRWKRAGQQGALGDKSVQEFHREIAQRLARYLDLKQLKIHDRIIASVYSYDFGGRRYVYLPGMDMDYESFSLGFVMTAFGIKDAIENGLKEFDFMRGNEEYKYHFTKTFRTNVAFYFSKYRLKFKLFCLLEGL